jgi:hypothetical protein
VQGLQGGGGAGGNQGAQGTQGLRLRVYQQPTPIGISSEVGDLWIDDDTGVIYTYYDDGNSYQWVEFGPDPTGPIGPQGIQGSLSNFQGTQGLQGRQGTFGPATIPENIQSIGVIPYTLQLSDVGKYISIVNAGVTIPASIFSAGDVISIYNNGGTPLSGTLGVSGTVNSDMADETLIDIIGVIGQDGNNGTNDAFLFTSANNSVTSGSTKDRILVRSRSTTSPNTTFTGSEWMAFPVVISTSSGLLQPDSKTSSFGSHSSSTFDLIYAENYAYLFLNGTANKAGNCTDAGLNWTSSLETNFNLLTVNEKSAFTNNTNNSTNITNALARYNHLRTYTPSLSNFAGI